MKCLCSSVRTCVGLWGFWRWKHRWKDGLCLTTYMNNQRGENIRENFSDCLPFIFIFIFIFKRVKKNQQHSQGNHALVRSSNTAALRIPFMKQHIHLIGNRNRFMLRWLFFQLEWHKDHFEYVSSFIALERKLDCIENVLRMIWLLGILCQRFNRYLISCN